MISRSAGVLAVVLAVAPACGQGAREPARVVEEQPAVAAPKAAPAPPARPPFRRCVTPEAGPPVRPVPFTHKRSLLVTAQGSPRHMAQDVFLVPGKPAVLAAKIAYGKTGKDLEDEEVSVQVFDCEGWRELGRARTDDDGRARVEVVGGAPLPVGTYAVRHVVPGDGSMASSRLTVVPASSRLVVFDIDGTLTTSDGEINRQVADDVWERMYAGDYIPEAHAGGGDLTRAWADRGFLLLYLTGRPYWLSAVSRSWLEEGGYGDGHVVTTDRHRDVEPSADGVGAFKTGVLRELVAAGLHIEAAYGNAPTDIQAYAAVGVPPDRTFIIGPHGGDGGTVMTGPDYLQRVAEVKAGAPARQPYRPQ